MRSLIDPADEPADRGAYPGTSHPFYWAPYILMGEVVGEILGETADDRSDRSGTIS
jgi:hypothetical protein